MQDESRSALAATIDSDPTSNRTSLQLTMPRLQVAGGGVVGVGEALLVPGDSLSFSGDAIRARPPEGSFDVNVVASDSIELLGGEILAVSAGDPPAVEGGPRAASSLFVAAPQIRLASEGSKLRIVTVGEGDAGKLRVVGYEGITLEGGEIGGVTALQTEGCDGPCDPGSSGTVSIDTPELLLRAGGKISTSTVGEGDAGDVLRKPDPAPRQRRQ